MIELHGEVGSEEKIGNQKPGETFNEKTVEEPENATNQVQINTLQINRKIRNTYIKRNGRKYIIKWLHCDSRNKEETFAYQAIWNKFDQLLELRDALFRSNFNLLALISTIDKITIDKNDPKN
jgi:hypothetical protein